METSQGGDEAMAHRALGHPSRVRILEVLRAEGRALDAEEIATTLGLHYNTVRVHLGTLLKAGLVQRRSQDRTEAGRPRWLFEAVAAEDQPSAYRLLAQILASYLQATGNGAAAAEAAGHAWGRYLVQHPAPGEAVTETEALATIRDLMRRLGFEPESAEGWKGRGARRDSQGASVLLLHHCPFRPLVDEAPEVICSVHLGLIRGALQELRAPVRARRLDPLVEPSLCVTHLEAVAAKKTGERSHPFSGAERDPLPLGDVPSIRWPGRREGLLESLEHLAGFQTTRKDGDCHVDRDQPAQLGQDGGASPGDDRRVGQAGGSPGGCWS